MRERALPGRENGMQGMRLIDADELCKKMHRTNRASASVEDIKSARIFWGESVRRIGKWELGKSGIMYACSECTCAATPREAEQWNYCPRCGTKMEEE